METLLPYVEIGYHTTKGCIDGNIARITNAIE